MGKQWKQWQSLFSWAPKSLQMVSTAMKLTLAPCRKSYDQPKQHIKKQRHYFANKGPFNQRYDFSSSHIWIWELNYKESWVWRIDTFELWCWRRLLRVPWTVRKSNQSILKEISPEYSLMEWCWSWSSSTLATWYKELTPWKRPWCWERLKVGREGDDRGWDGWVASPSWWRWVWVGSGNWWWTGKPGVLQSMGSQRVRHHWLNWRLLLPSLPLWAHSKGIMLYF